MSTYHQLTLEERYHIYGLKRAGYSITTIADELKRHKSTISRELKRNIKSRGWRPLLAHTQAVERRSSKAKKRISHDCWELVIHYLKQRWSPEQVSGRIKISHNIKISHERIYQFIYKDKSSGGLLHQYLCRKKKYHKRAGIYETRGRFSTAPSIDDRPSIVDERVRLGDWELDTVFGVPSSANLVSMVDRTSRIARFIKVNTRKSDIVSAVIIEQLRALNRPVHSLTSDNGKEFSQYQTMAKELGTDFYFAHPYSSWERGTNENTNGLLRRFFPKGTDFDKVTQEEIDWVVDKLNNRPRKCLGFRTPNEVFWEIKTVALTT
jgi:IS30 family transposase